MEESHAIQMCPDEEMLICRSLGQCRYDFACTAAEMAIQVIDRIEAMNRPQFAKNLRYMVNQKYREAKTVEEKSDAMKELRGSIRAIFHEGSEERQLAMVADLEWSVLRDDMEKLNRSCSTATL